MLLGFGAESSLRCLAPRLCPFFRVFPGRISLQEGTKGLYTPNMLGFVAHPLRIFRKILVLGARASPRTSPLPPASPRRSQEPPTWAVEGEAYPMRVHFVYSVRVCFDVSRCTNNTIDTARPM